MSSVTLEVLPIWFEKPVMAPFWPGNESRSDGLRSSSCRVESDGAVAGSGPVSDAPRLAIALRLRPLCGDGLRPADLPGKPARHRGLPSVSIQPVLSPGHPRASDADE